MANDKIRVGIVGATGYTGQELARLLVDHPHAELVAATSRTYAGKPLSDVFPNLRKKVSVVCDNNDLLSMAKNVDFIFLALPHGEAAGMVTAEILKETKIIDLGADFRLDDEAEYKQWYHLDHANPALINDATYGLCELNRDAIVKSRLIANPGCYATCSILSVIPLLKADLIARNSIIIDAKSGVSGAGRGLALGSHFNECNESIKAYALASHRHTPEIEQELSRHCGEQILLNFTPHLVPMNRGILVTAYASLKSGVDHAAVRAAYEKLYGDAHFIRLYDSETDPNLPETRWVKGSNYCDISFKLDLRTGRIIVVAALDNLLKGAAGQAIQNMNLMSGLNESTGIDSLPTFP
jgi:N-acetyl-gamma-glutamyl-phosphate reductase